MRYCVPTKARSRTSIGADAFHGRRHDLLLSAEAMTKTLLPFEPRLSNELRARVSSSGLAEERAQIREIGDEGGGLL